MFVWRLCWVVNLPIDLSIPFLSMLFLSLSLSLPFIQLSHWWPADPLWLLGVVAGAGAGVARGGRRRSGDCAPSGHQHRATPGEAVERRAELPAAAGSAGRRWEDAHTWRRKRRGENRLLSFLLVWLFFVVFPVFCNVRHWMIVSIVITVGHNSDFMFHPWQSLICNFF